MVCKDSKNMSLFQNPSFFRKPCIINISTLITVFFLFLSCQTAPKIQNMPEGTLPLDKGASVYVLADVKQALPIIELLPIEELNNNQTRQMLERTDSFVAALFPQTSSRKMQIAANGNYPGLSGLGLTFKKNWKKQRIESGGSYWYSAENGLSILINSNQAFVVSSADKAPVNPIANVNGVTMPEGFYEFSKGYPVSCWLEDTAPLINKIFNKTEMPVRFPVQYIFINLYPAEYFTDFPADYRADYPAYYPAGLPNSKNQYEALVRLQFENAIQSRGMAAIFNLAAGLISNDDSASNDDFVLASILLANPAVQNGRNIDIKTKRLTEKDITLLLETFLLY